MLTLCVVHGTAGNKSKCGEEQQNSKGKVSEDTMEITTCWGHKTYLDKNRLFRSRFDTSSLDVSHGALALCKSSIVTRAMRRLARDAMSG